jgi:hypothetical protein
LKWWFLPDVAPAREGQIATKPPFRELTPFATVARFALVVAATVLVLAILNLLPAFLGGEPLGVVRYSSADAIEAEYGVRLWRPALLPEGFSWPPSVLRVAVEDPEWVQFVFTDRTGGGDSLVVCQTLNRTAAGGPVHHTEVSSRLLVPAEVLETSDVAIDGRPVRLRRLLLADGAIVYDAWWQEGTRSVMLRVRGSAEELTRAARLALGSRS